MSSASAYRWGRMIARRRRLVLGVWVLVLIACAAAYPGAEALARGAQLRDRRSGVLARGAAARTALRQPWRRAGRARVLLRPRAAPANPPIARSSPARSLTARDKAYVKGVAGPYARGARGQISRDGHAAIALVGIAGDPRQLIERATLLQEALDPLAGAGVHVWLTGYSPVAKDITTVENEDVERAETIGVPIALLILLLALGAAVAAVVPLAIAGSGLLLTYGFLAVLATMLTFDSFLTTIVTMIGVGIGIDYALFIVSRFREELARRRSPDRPVTQRAGRGGGRRGDRELGPHRPVLRRGRRARAGDARRDPGADLPRVRARGRVGRGVHGDRRADSAPGRARAAGAAHRPGRAARADAAARRPPGGDATGMGCGRAGRWR